jgi:hypothetical protein
MKVKIVKVIKIQYCIVIHDDILLTATVQGRGVYTKPADMCSEWSCGSAVWPTRMRGF